jgi:hypothetical protein
MFEFTDLIEYVLENGLADSESWGLPVYKIASGEYAIASDEGEANKAVAEYIKESIWAFSPGFISQHCTANLPVEVIQLIQEKCEDANPIILDLIESFDKFVDDAISADGRGHFLASYDGEEHELGNYLIYRIN